MLFIFVTSYTSDENISDQKGLLFHNVFFLFNNVYECQHDIKAGCSGKPVSWARCTQPGSQGQMTPPLLRSAGASRDRASGHTFYVLQQAGQEKAASLQPAILLFIGPHATSIPTEKAQHTQV